MSNGRIKHGKRLSVVSLAAAALALSAGAAEGEPLEGTAAFQSLVTLPSIHEHLEALQAIADENGGTRASGTAGYDRSADYVAQQLAAAGYAVVRQPFEFEFFQELSPPLLEQLSPVTVTYPPDDPAGVFSFSYSAAGDVTGRVQGVDLQIPAGAAPNSSTSGCEPDDFIGFLPGNIALLQRGTCSFAAKVLNAAAAGASAAIVLNEGQPGRTDAIPGNLRGAAVSIPAVGISYDVGVELAAASAEVHVVVDAFTETRRSENVLADSRCGDGARTIVVGAHLDSVLEGPGINDNGSGTAVTLEIAEQLATLPCHCDGLSVLNRVRFAFWGAEESGVAGSAHYLSSLPPEELSELALNLNFDMVGSTNFVRFVYDGDGSDTGLAGPPGSEQIESLFIEHFAALGLATAPTQLDGRSDYAPFQLRGIPVGGLFSGAEGVKTEEQAAVFGGTAGVAYDACYHAACDTLENVSDEALEQLSAAAADVVLTLASRQQPIEVPAPVALPATP